MGKRFYEALHGLWLRRAVNVVDQALEEAERAWAELSAREDVLWYARMLPETLEILELNAAAQRYLQCDARRSLSLLDYLQPGNRAAVRELVDLAIESGRTAEGQLRDRNGRLMQLSFQPVKRDGQQQVLGFAHHAVYRLHQRREFELIE